MGDPKSDPKSPGRRLRSDTSYFLGLKEEDSLPPGGLPTNKNVLEVILLHKSKNKGKSVEKLVCCPLNKTFDALCDKPGGCHQNQDPTQRCIVSQIMERYSQAGFPVIKVSALKRNCVVLFQSYWDDIRKHGSRDGKKVLEKRNAFVAKLGSLFKAYPDNVEEMIKTDKKRKEKDITEDLNFFQDQQLDWPLRKMGFDSLDRRYVKAVRAEAERQARTRQREADFQGRREREAERRRRSEIRVSFADLDGIIGAETENNNNNSSNNNVVTEEKKDDYLPTKTKKAKGAKRTGQKNVHIPHDLLARSVPLATLNNLSTGQHVNMIAGILNILSCNLDHFTVSHSSAARLRLLMNSAVARMIKAKYTKEVKATGARIFIHYDGKLMEILLRFLVKRKKNDRVGILARSPDLPDDMREQLLGIPGLASGTGKLKLNYYFHVHHSKYIFRTCSKECHHGAH